MGLRRSLFLVFISLSSNFYISYTKELAIKIQKCSNNVTQDCWITPEIFRSNHRERVDNNNNFRFELELQGNVCKNQIAIYTVSSEENMPTSLFSADGSLSIVEEEEAFDYSVLNYCINSIENSSIQVQVCKSNPSNLDCETGEICIPKCCPFGQVLKTDLSFYSEPFCADVTTDWKPFVYPLAIPDNSSEPSYLESKEFSFKYVQYELPKCFPKVNLFIPNSKALRPLQAEIRIYANGEVYTKRIESDDWTGPHSPGNFCIDGLWDSGNSNNFSREPSNQIVVACDYEKSATHTKRNTANVIVIVFTAILICLIISSVCLLATVVVYIILWKEQNIHGWTIIAMAMSQFLYFTAVSISTGVALYYSAGIGTVWCKGIGIFQHFFNMATYTWLTVLNCDLWMVIRSNKPSRHLGHGIKRFILYSLYGFGVPFILLCFSLTMEFHFGLINDKIIKPEYGRVTCGVSTTESYYYYAVIVTMLLYLVTIVFSVLTVISVIKAKRDTKRVDNANNKSHNNKLIFIAKLSILFGFPWIFEFVFSNMTIQPFSIIFWMRISITFMNALQGVGMFWVFVLQKKTKTQLVEKFCKNQQGNTKSTAESQTARTDSTNVSTTASSE